MLKKITENIRLFAFKNPYNLLILANKINNKLPDALKN